MHAGRLRADAGRRAERARASTRRRPYRPGSRPCCRSATQARRVDGTRVSPIRLLRSRLDVATAETAALRHAALIRPRHGVSAPASFRCRRSSRRSRPEVFLPGVGVLPNDFIMAVKTNPRFVEALMLGANHEMGRELLWQGFPDRPARDAVSALLAALQRRRRHRADSPMDRRASRLAAGKYGDAGPADPRPAARAVPDAVDLRVPAGREREPPGRQQPARCRGYARSEGNGSEPDDPSR